MPVPATVPQNRTALQGNAALFRLLEPVVLLDVLVLKCLEHLHVLDVVELLAKALVKVRVQRFDDLPYVKVVLEYGDPGT